MELVLTCFRFNFESLHPILFFREHIIYHHFRQPIGINDNVLFQYHVVSFDMVQVQEKETIDYYGYHSRHIIIHAFDKVRILIKYRSI